jgi:uncharacterized membrane-anchored protein YhcB (DUF1043 family)
MADPIVFEDLFQLVALEINESAEDLKETLVRNPPGLPAILAKLEEGRFSSAQLTLAEPITSSDDSAPLLASNVVLTARYLKSLLSRQLQAERALGPIALVPNQPALEHYKTGIVKRFTRSSEDLLQATDPSSRSIYEKISSSRELDKIPNDFKNIVERVVTVAEGLNTLIRVLYCQKSKSFITSATNSSIISMAIGSLCDSVTNADTLAIGTAALLQDISLALDETLQVSEHPESSAELADEIGMEEGIIELIRRHHDVINTSSGGPALANLSDVSPQARVLITLNVFLSMLKQEAGCPFEIMKKLNYLASKKYVDAHVASVIATLYLPKLKAYVLEKASNISSYCKFEDSTPILWPLAGEKVPAVFLCRDDSCEHKTEQWHSIAKEIEFSMGQMTIDTIQKGTYFTCPLLTTELKNMYAAVRERIKR